jgi:hypothetical protein
MAPCGARCVLAVSSSLPSPSRDLRAHHQDPISMLDGLRDGMTSSADFLSWDFKVPLRRTSAWPAPVVGVATFSLRLTAAMPSASPLCRFNDLSGSPASRSGDVAITHADPGVRVVLPVLRLSTSFRPSDTPCPSKCSPHHQRPHPHTSAGLRWLSLHGWRLPSRR